VSFLGSALPLYTAMFVRPLVRCLDYKNWALPYTIPPYGDFYIQGNIFHFICLQMSLAPPELIAIQMVRNAMEFKTLAVSVRRGFVRYHVSKNINIYFENDVLISGLRHNGGLFPYRVWNLHQRWLRG
jgi:hypothetical protein